MERQIGDLAVQALNIPEKVIIVLDRAQDEQCTLFKVEGKNMCTLDCLKEAVSLFIHNKLEVCPQSHIALMTINECSASWNNDFTRNPRELLHTLGQIKACLVEDKFNLELVFDSIKEHVKVDFSEYRNIPPPYMVHVLFVYSRSYTIPEINVTGPLMNMLSSPYFVVDTCITHKNATFGNNVDKITEVLKQMNVNKMGYFYSEGKRSLHLFNNFGRLLGHPLQRFRQENADYSLQSALARLTKK